MSRDFLNPLYIDGPLRGGSYPLNKSRDVSNGIRIQPGVYWDKNEERIRTDGEGTSETVYYLHRFPVSPSRHVAIASVHHEQHKLNWIEIVEQLLSDRAKWALIV